MLQRRIRTRLPRIPPSVLNPPQPRDSRLRDRQQSGGAPQLTCTQPCSGADRDNDCPGPVARSCSVPSLRACSGQTQTLRHCSRPGLNARPITRHFFQAPTGQRDSPLDQAKRSLSGGPGPRPARSHGHAGGGAHVPGGQGPGDGAAAGPRALSPCSIPGLRWSGLLKTPALVSP